MSMPEESPRYAGPRYGLAQNLNDGYQAGRDASLSPGLEAQSQRWNELAQGNLGKPTSVLSQIGLSPIAQNASAPDMADRYNSFSGQVLPNLQTGSSAESAETAMRLHFMGDEEA